MRGVKVFGSNGEQISPKNPFPVQLRGLTGETVLPREVRTGNAISDMYPIAPDIGARGVMIKFMASSVTGSFNAPDEGWRIRVISAVNNTGTPHERTVDVRSEWRIQTGNVIVVIHPDAKEAATEYLAPEVRQFIAIPLIINEGFRVIGEIRGEFEPEEGVDSECIFRYLY